MSSRGPDLEEATRLDVVDGGLHVSLREEYGFTDRVTGGYLLTIALRAASMSTSLPRPAAVSAQFLLPGQVGECSVRVTALRTTRTVETFDVALNQAHGDVLRALVTFSDPSRPGLVHDVARPPGCSPEDVLDTPSVQERGRAQGMQLSGVHDRLECRYLPPGDGVTTQRSPTCDGWVRFDPPGPFASEIVDDGRALFVADFATWLAVLQGHSSEPFGSELAVIGASLDFNATFHAHASTPWLYSRAECPAARDGLHGVLSQVFDERGVLCVSSLSTLVGIPMR